MKESNTHLFRCIDVIKADKTLSDNTLIIMFVEYAKLCAKEGYKTDAIVSQNEENNTKIQNK